MGELGRRGAAMVVTVAVLAAATVISSTGAGGAEAPPDARLTPSATQGRPGDTVTVGISGCNFDGDDFKRAVLRLATTGDEPVVVALGNTYGSSSATLTLPDWYQPGPGRIMADCFSTTFDDDGNGSPVLAFSFPPVDFELLAGDVPSHRVMSLGRVEVGEGQTIPVELTGCDPSAESSSWASVVLVDGEGEMLAGFDRLASGDAGADAAGNAHVDLPVVSDDRSLASGSYLVVGQCFRGEEATLYQPAVITVTANAAVGTTQLERHDEVGTVVVSGAGCTAEVVLSLQSEDTSDRQVVAPAADGSWSYVWTQPVDGAYWFSVTADCGDPAGDGFRYQSRSINFATGPPVWVARVSPTTSPVGGPIDVHFSGACPSPVAIDLMDSAGATMWTGTVEMADHFGVARLQAPARAGRYAISARCERLRRAVGSLDVFDPGPVVSPDPVPPSPPATGWPSAGPVEHFSGRVGPINLPADGDMGSMDTTALPSAGTALALPRPEGDFAIRSIRYDLVDTDTLTSVPRADAHLHHFVLGKTGGQNPACPGGTFGVPGEVIGAVGQERTMLDLPEPYGEVVRGDDVWGGLYEVMNTGERSREVYITYDLTIQRDLSNIRPLTPYFTSAAGCGLDRWMIDGSGTEDHQSTYISIQKDGLLVNGGGHVHSGGEASELYDDRGRLLCRAELQLGEGTGHGGHGGHGDMSTSMSTTTGPTTSSPTTTTMVMPPDDDWPPPEFYPDDPPIDAISTCPAINQPVRAGERLRYDAIYTNERPRRGVMGITLFFVWEGGGPADPVVLPNQPPTPVPGAVVKGTSVQRAPAARPVKAQARLTG